MAWPTHCVPRRLMHPGRSSIDFIPAKAGIQEFSAEGQNGFRLSPE
jgi:hypothetical protein